MFNKIGVLKNLAKLTGKLEGSRKLKTLLKKETSEHVFSIEFSETFKSVLFTRFIECQQTIASLYS